MARKLNGGGSSNISRDYLEALNDFWSGRTRTAIEHVTQILASAPDHENGTQLYRLWIELLAEEGDVDAMRSLNNHLRGRSDFEPEMRETYFALRGIIHCELDEFEAVRLMHDSLNKKHNNPYVREFNFRFRHRTEDEVNANAFVANPRNLTDYFHWQLYSENLLRDSRRSELRKVFGKLDEIFPGNPVADRLMMYDAIDSHDFEASAEFAARLYENFPSYSDYAVVQAYSLIKAGKHSDALPVLTRLIAVEGEGDADLVSMIGHCFKEDFSMTRSEKSRERAGYYLRRASNMLTSMGLPSVLVNHDFNAIRGKGTMDAQAKSAEHAGWLVKLSASQYLDLGLSDDHSVEILTMHLSEKAVPGDLCFIATEHFSRREEDAQWRVGAVYMVSSEPTWHAMRGTESALSLVGKFAASIPVPVFDQHRSIYGSQTGSVTAVPLDGKLFEKFMTAMEEMSGGDRSAQMIFREVSRLRAV